MMKSILTALALLLSTTAMAQPPNVVSYQVQLFPSGANTQTATPVQTTTIQAAAMQCGQTPPALTMSVVNPTRIFFEDPANATKVCTTDLAAFFATIPSGTYTATITWTDNIGLVADRSDASSPFEQRGKPIVLKGLRIGR
jgi:hypothetical protein